jgi:hypothetical protein
MSLLGVHLTVLVGPAVPLPLPYNLLQSLQSVEVTHSDQGRSGFQMVFQVGRSSQDVLDYPLISSPLLKPLNRVILMVAFGVMPTVLMDGIITNQQFNPGSQPGSSTFTITGEDVSVMMDRHEKNVEHPAQNEFVIALKIIASYAQYGLIPMLIPPPTLDVPLPTDRIPVQQATDLQYLLEMAQRFDYVFYVIPGPAPGVNKAYWGPPLRVGLPQKALTFNMGPSSNVSQLDIQNNANAPTAVSGNVQDRSSNQSMPVQSMAGSRPPLSLEPPNPTTMRTTVLRQSATNAAQAMTRAQAITDASLNEVITVTGELNTAAYGDLLTARELVGLRGAGFKHDGLYYVKQVTHQIARGQYKQRFTLTREGLGANIPVVRP